MRQTGIIFAAALALGLFATGCKRERTVELTLVTEPRDGQVVQDDYIEMVEGQAMGVRVVGVKKDQRHEEWKVEVSSKDPGILFVRPTDKDDVFVFSGAKNGLAELLFTVDGKYDVVLDAEVLSRPE